MSNVISADVPDDLKDDVEAAREEGESRSAAVRRLIRTGLREQSNTGFPLPVPLYFAWLGTIAAAAGLLEASPTVGMGGVAIFAASMIYYAADR